MAIDIPVRAALRAADAGEEPIVFIELQYADYSGEDDIERQIGTLSLRRVSASRFGRRTRTWMRCQNSFPLGGHLVPTTRSQAPPRAEVLIVLVVVPTLCLLAAEYLNNRSSRRTQTCR
jgi:hypothetical protein